MRLRDWLSLASHSDCMTFRSIGGDVDVIATECDRQEPGANEDEDRVDADDFERAGEAAPAADVEYQQAGGKDDHREAAGEQDEAAGPEFFVDGEGDSARPWPIDGER